MIRWNLTNFLKLTQDELAKNFVKAGVYFVSQQRQFLNRDQPYRRAPSGRHTGFDPSLPGEFPRKLTGQLMRSVTWSFDKSKMALTVGSNLKPYPAILQSGSSFMEPRPWLSLGFAQVRERVGQIIVGKG